MRLADCQCGTIGRRDGASPAAILSSSALLTPVAAAAGTSSAAGSAAVAPRPTSDVNRSRSSSSSMLGSPFAVLPSYYVSTLPTSSGGSSHAERPSGGADDTSASATLSQSPTSACDFTPLPAYYASTLPGGVSGGGGPQMGSAPPGPPGGDAPVGRAQSAFESTPPASSRLPSIAGVSAHAADADVGPAVLPTTCSERRRGGSSFCEVPIDCEGILPAAAPAATAGGAPPHAGGSGTSTGLRAAAIHSKLATAAALSLTLGSHILAFLQHGTGGTGSGSCGSDVKPASATASSACGHTSPELLRIHTPRHQQQQHHQQQQQHAGGSVQRRKVSVDGSVGSSSSMAGGRDSRPPLGGGGSPCAVVASGLGGTPFLHVMLSPASLLLAAAAEGLDGSGCGRGDGGRGGGGGPDALDLGPPADTTAAAEQHEPAAAAAETGAVAVRRPSSTALVLHKQQPAVLARLDCAVRGVSSASNVHSGIATAATVAPRQLGAPPASPDVLQWMRQQAQQQMQPKQHAPQPQQLQHQQHQVATLAQQPRAVHQPGGLPPLRRSPPLLPLSCGRSPPPLLQASGDCPRDTAQLLRQDSEGLAVLGSAREPAQYTDWRPHASPAQRRVSALLDAPAVVDEWALV